MRRSSPAAVPFADPALGAKNLRNLSELFASSGSSQPLAKFMTQVEMRLLCSPDPDRVLAHLLRFIETSFNSTSLFTDLTVYPATLDLMFSLFGHSQYLAEVLIRDPELFDWLREGDALTRPVDAAGIASEITSSFALFSKEERRLSALKRIHRRELLKISAQDILGHADLASVTRQLSDLADTIADAVLELCFAQLSARFEEKPPVPFAIIGLGKVGGQELNYSSDIDVLFVYGSEGTLNDRAGRETTFLEYFTQLAALFIRTMSQSMGDELLYRVDARLRPEGNAGPLARSVHGYLGYYEARGDLWERQMLLKARPMAGDREFGREFLGLLEPFVFPRTFLQHPADAILRMKTRIEQKIGDRANIKLRAGGIRDIEFIVQGLQLINGGKRKQLREKNTLKAIALLADAGLLPSDDAALLTKAYVFYRTIEHRLQIFQNRQTHTLPDEPEKLRSLALRLGMNSVASLQRTIESTLRKVRSVFDRVMAADRPDESVGITGVIDGVLGENATGEVLREYGIMDLRQALRSIRSIAGDDLAGQRRLDSRARTTLREIAGSLFGAIAKTADPDLTLKNLAHLLMAHPAPASMIKALGEKRLRALVLDIASGSTWITRRLAADPLLFDGILADPLALHAFSHEGPQQKLDIHVDKRRVELRAALRYLLGFAALEELTTELSGLADRVITEVLSDLAQKSGATDLPAIFALGKLGSRELMIDADLDLMLVAPARDGRRSSEAERLSGELLRALGTVSEHGFLYSVDVRLRPEGRNGPLTVEEQSYRTYLKTRASFWERQSMTRMRFVCGDSALGEEIRNIAEEYVYESPLPRDWVEQVSAMRKKIETKGGTSGASPDIKRGSGGMIDIEFIVQMIQLRYGRSKTSLRSRSVYDILRGEACPGITFQQQRLLMEHYAFFRRTEAMIRLALEGRSSVLPTGPSLQTLARCTTHSDKDQFRAEIIKRMKDVRALYHEIAHRLAGESA